MTDTPNGTRTGQDLIEFARSLPSLYQLVPEYACVEKGTDYLKTTRDAGGRR